MTNVTINQIYNELINLKSDVNFIKNHMFDPDAIMTTEESKRFEEALKELKEGKTTSLSDLKKELGI